MPTFPPAQAPLVPHRHIRQAVLCRHWSCALPLLLPFAVPVATRVCVPACGGSCSRHTQSFGLPPAVILCLTHTVFFPPPALLLVSTAPFSDQPVLLLFCEVWRDCFDCRGSFLPPPLRFCRPEPRRFLPQPPSNFRAVPGEFALPVAHSFPRSLALLLVNTVPFSVPSLPVFPAACGVLFRVSTRLPMPPKAFCFTCTALLPSGSDRFLQCTTAFFFRLTLNFFLGLALSFVGGETRFTPPP